MASNKVKIGSLIVTPILDRNLSPVLDSQTGEPKKRISIGLGSKGKDPRYNFSVELTVRDSTGQVVAHQTDGFINLIDPRTQADDLLAAGKITEEVAERMREQARHIPDKIRYQLVVQKN